MCCSNGKVKLRPLVEPHDILKSLLLGEHPLSKHFLRHLRQYNCLFQMTSFGCTEHKEGFYMPTFKIQGQIYHRIGSLLPTTNPGFLQVYFLSEADQMSLRQNIVPNLNPEILQMIQSMLHTHNQYIKSFNACLEQAPPNILDYKILIRADIIPVNYHRGSFNQPTTNEVAI